VEWLNTIQGCLIAGTRMIVAVDTNESKLGLARRFGATHTVNAKSEEGVAKTVKKITQGGADYGFECIGFGETAAVVKILNTTELKERLAGQGAEVVADTPEQFAAFIRHDTALLWLGVLCFAH
jgi:Zn-dependent alcohol dehydrogenase